MIARIQLVSATAGFGSACFDCSLAISSSHTSLGVLYPRSFMGVFVDLPDDRVELVLREILETGSLGR